MKQAGLQFWLPLILLVLGLSLVGCSPITRAEQGTLTTTVSLEPGQQVGQTFTANFAGLSGVSVFINPQTSSPASGTLRFHLKSSPTASQDLAQAELPLSQVTGSAYYRFQFPPQAASTQADYSFFIELDGKGFVELGSAPGSAYLDGSLYADGVPVEGQMAFQLAYNPADMGVGLLVEAAGWMVALLAAAFLLVLPGWALLATFLPEWTSLGWPEKTALSTGVSLPLYPVLFLWARLAGIYPGAAWAWGPPVIAGGFLLWKIGSWQSHGRRLSLASLRVMRQSANFWPNLVLGMVLLVIFGVRFWAIRGIDVPLWGDSYQHTMIAQRLLENGGLFDTWKPYVPYESLTVQYGFPVLAALWSWLTGEDILRATLVIGQITNGLAILALYPLALLLTRGNRWAGNFSLMAAGLFMQVPAFYVNWGRYAQLSGQVVLPVALTLLLYLTLRKGRVGIGEIFINALVLAGMLLHYYRMAFYYVTFLPVLLIVAFPLLKERWPVRMLALIATAGLAVALLLPWVPNVMGSNLTSMVESGISNATPSKIILGDFSAWQEVGSHIPISLLIAATVAIIAALALRRWVVSSLLLWVGLLTAFRLGMFIGLPGSNMMQSFAVMIFLYIPVSIVLGWMVGEVVCAWLKRWPQVAMPGLLLGVILALLLGARIQRGIVNPNVYAITTRPDMRAMQWIRTNTSSEAVFLVEGFTIYGGSTAVGSDGGWWLPLLAGRSNTMPPQYALMNERSSSPDYSREVIDLIATLENNALTAAAAVESLCRWKITHVYIGQKQGRASTEQKQLFAPEDFDGWPLLYAQDRVRIFAMPEKLCQKP